MSMSSSTKIAITARCSITPVGARRRASTSASVPSSELSASFWMLRVVRAAPATDLHERSPEHDPPDDPAVPDLEGVRVEGEDHAEQDDEAESGPDEHRAHGGHAEQRPRLLERRHAPAVEHEDAEEHEGRRHGERRNEVEREHPLVEPDRQHAGESTESEMPTRTFVVSSGFLGASGYRGGGPAAMVAGAPRADGEHRSNGRP